ncbi:hypothetical protein HBH56_194460 [Parastagonospora nodorum]|uniref:LYC1 C-terminal domain-containing protein n=2 Tax=Phaeosphaeria nodorum (strain SN15 / ATCC MYA-4574 / FGSC 10173) TaxID=321614 RepID=A0A7U2I3I5_PHANO|nr:hypothetical protein SNOG_09020 [Parastagonospora nodorum SN15]KAH3906979.1 hypothetical protein HBH56_194460 [Parastagonospora nodorum]EAT83212.1 hypothetical protein SNOG_09020 [Parastagonospora nodorum SN15]KAH3924992.1 hypothetical protein HBH54_189050 [Parastagonospora nodorum]KAH3976484.1 hypothetical protein HBH52_117320 [Parastagonospora nodorum]KAH3984302.1 hypothetical protein HBH51_031320 [Parastagonospora nodorum]
MDQTVNLEMAEDAHSAHLCLAHPTQEELISIWNHTAASWIDSLSISAYLEESQHMATAPLARDGGMTNWILVDGRLPPGKRAILSSCESFRKRALTSDQDGNVTATIIHGIASVFCFPEHRGRSYTKRLMQELAKELPKWQIDDTSCIGSILYSDIGKEYYAKLGWKPNESNTQIVLPALKSDGSNNVTKLVEADLPTLCAKDEAQLRKSMAIPTKDATKRVSIISDVDHMGWHFAKEEIACRHIFDTVPETKGALAGPPGNQTWVTWQHRYYKHPDLEATNNVLYILRLVVEADETASRLPSHAEKMPGRDLYEQQKSQLKAVLHAAQNEAFEWKLDSVHIWDPTPLVQRMLKEMDIPYNTAERTVESVASGMWYDGNDGISTSPPLWLNNEHYAWC